MCKEIVVFPIEIKEKMGQLYPKDLSEDYFDAYEELVKQHVIKNKDKGDRVIRKNVRIIGENEECDVIYPTFIDAILARKQLVEIFNK